MVFTKFTPLLALVALAADASAMPHIDAGVHRTLRQQATVDLIITLKTGVDSGSTPSRRPTSPRAARRSPPSSRRSRPTLPKFEVLGNSTAQITPLANEWGVTKVQAPSVWSAGYTGQNIVVGSLDTGVLATHTSIAANFRSTYNWYDAVSKRTTPYDDVGHGTHTIGTIAGLSGLGVAPGTNFIACKAFTSTGGSQSALLSCAQPYPLVAMAARPSHIIRRLGRELTIFGRGLRIKEWLAEATSDERDKFD